MPSTIEQEPIDAPLVDKRRAEPRLPPRPGGLNESTKPPG